MYFSYTGGYMTRIHVLQHVPFETPGSIAELAQEYHCPMSATHLWESTDFPDPDAFDLLVVMGGPMNIYAHAEYPWLTAEKAFITHCIDVNKKMLGICLGSQLLADALGATVVKNRVKEIGWYAVSLTKDARDLPVLAGMPPGFIPFHWHGDTYPPPPGSVRLGSSDACENQGFIFDNRIIALQFHLEMTAESLKVLIEACKNELVLDEYVQSAREIFYYAEKRLAPARMVMERLFKSLIAP